jgi:hypothetical protein
LNPNTQINATRIIRTPQPQPCNDECAVCIRAGGATPPGRAKKEKKEDTEKEDTSNT